MAAASTGWKNTFCCLHHYQSHFIIAVPHTYFVLQYFDYRSEDIELFLDTVYTTGQRFGVREMFS